MKGSRAGGFGSSRRVDRRTARCCGYDGSDHIRLAAIIEFLHTATLLHDDVVDRSDLRRGRATANVTWGNAPSVLVGDFLYSRAFQLMVDLDDMDIMAIVADATNIIAEGEVLQLDNIGNAAFDEAGYMEVILRKTALLFQAAAHTAAVLATRDSETIQSMRRYGRDFGLAYQLVDDWLDYEGDSAVMGKNIGDDLAEGKATLPLIRTMKYGCPEDAALVRDALETRCPEALATAKASRRSFAENEWNDALTTGDQRANRFRDPRRHDSARRRELLQIPTRQLGRDNLQPFLDFLRAEPGEGQNGIAGRTVCPDELPAGGVAQLHGQCAQAKTSMRPGCQVYRGYGNLRSQPEHVRRSTPGADNSLAPQSRKRADNVFQGRRTHIDSPVDAHQPTIPGEARQRLIDGCSFPDVKQVARADGSPFRQGAGIFHYAL